MVAMAAAVDYGQWLVDDDSGEAGIEAVGRSAVVVQRHEESIEEETAGGGVNNVLVE